MQTTFQYSHRLPDEKAVKYVLPANLNDRYKQLDPQTQQILKATQKCPFTTIRQLIIAFKRTEPYSTDIQVSDILRQKYMSNVKLSEADNSLNTCIQEVQLSQFRFEKLLKSVNHYNFLYTSLVRQESVIGTEQHSGETKAEYNQRVYRKQNEQSLQKQNRYFQYTTYSQQLQRALVLASFSQSDKFKPEGMGQSALVANRIDNFRMLSDFSTKMTKQFDATSIQLTEFLFSWRQKAKNNLTSENDFIECQNKIESWRKRSSEMNEVYKEMTNFSGWLQKDRQQLRRVYETNSRSYQSFVPQLIKAKQVYEISSKNSFYYEIIREEKKKMETHLRKNYGMIIPYTVSDQFSKSILPIQNPQNRDLKMLIAEELTPLEDGLSYLNGDYEKLYKEACDSQKGNSNVRKKIQEKLLNFTKYSEDPTQDNTFALHLIESCRKLLRISN